VGTVLEMGSDVITLSLPVGGSLTVPIDTATRFVREDEGDPAIQIGSTVRVQPLAVFGPGAGIPADGQEPGLTVSTVTKLDASVR
jgi:hypothetical protein